MKNQMNLYYDKEGDFLEISTGNVSNCYFDNIGDGIFKIIDKSNQKVIGIAIFNFKNRTKDLQDLKISLPFKLDIF